MNEISVLGLGYVGLPAAIMFSRAGHTVRGVDINADLVHRIENGEIGGDEPGLAGALTDALSGGRLTASASPSPADVFVIAVPTPISDDHSPDLSSVIEACRSITDHLESGNLVVVESTIPPGVTSGVIAPLLEESGLKAGEEFSLAYCPERVLPGNIMAEIVENDRIIGGIDGTSTENAAALYQSFVTGTLHQTDAATAEMVKLAENTYRDVNIALANTLGNISESVSVNVWDVIELANKHPRVDLLKPGPGVGGHCIPVDPWFLVSADPESSALIQTARGVNDGQPGVIADHVMRACSGISNPRVALLGAAYKPDVSDGRESPTASLAADLSERGVSVAVTDPNVTRFDVPIQSLEEAVNGSDLMVLVVGHSTYRSLDPADIAGLVRRKEILDTTNLLDKSNWKRSGFSFDSYGHGTLPPAEL